MYKAFIYGFLSSLMIACQSNPVATDYDTSIDFKLLHFYALEFTEASGDSLMLQRLQTSVEKHISLTGLQKASNTQAADIVIRPTISSQQRTQEPSSRGGIGIGGGGGNTLFGISLSIPLGSDTVVNDIVTNVSISNNHNQKLIWQGSYAFTTKADDAEATNRLVNEAIKEIFSQYPPSDH